MSNATEITRLQNAKASIKASIENKGVTVGDITLDGYAEKIDAISQSGGSDQVIAGHVTLNRNINFAIGGLPAFINDGFIDDNFVDSVDMCLLDITADFRDYGYLYMDCTEQVEDITKFGTYYKEHFIRYANEEDYNGRRLPAKESMPVRIFNGLSSKLIRIIVALPSKYISKIKLYDDEGTVFYDGIPETIDIVDAKLNLDIDGDDMSYLLYRGDHRMRLFPYVDMSKCTDATYFMNECKLDGDGKPITSVDLRPLKMDGIKIDNGNYMFNAMTNCTDLILPESEWNVRATNYMFGGFRGSKIENLDKLGDDTGSTANIDHRNWFRGCPNLVEADLSGITAKPKSQNLWQNSFYQDNNLRKVWLPKTCVNIVATTQSYSMFNAVPASCVIFTDAPAQPSTWTGYWNYYNASSQCEVRYGSTHEEYEAY